MNNRKTIEAFVIGMLVFLAGCHVTKKPAPVHFVIVADVTEAQMPTFSEIDATRICKVLKLDTHSKNGATVSIYKISDTRYTQKFTETLPAKSEFELNLYERTTEIKEFNQRLQTALTQVQQDMEERKQSFVFHQVLTALKELSQVEGEGAKVLAITSDLCNNDAVFSVYRKKDMALLKNNPEKLMEKLDATYPLPASVDPIQVYFAHRTGTGDDATYHAMVQFLSAYLQTKNCNTRTVTSIDEIHINA